MQVQDTALDGVKIIMPARHGDARGLVSRTTDAEIIYRCSAYYAPSADGALRWDSCGIDWALEGDPILSEKDAAAQTLADFDSPFTYEGVAS